MALFKTDGYGSELKVEMGDEVPKEMEDQLTVKIAELKLAINQENLTDKIFARVLKNRSRAHQQLLECVPAASEK